MEWGYELQTKQVCEVSWAKRPQAKNWTFSGLAWPAVCLRVVSLWVILSPCLSERGWIATARDSDSGRYMMVKQVGCPKKSMHPPFSDKCHLTISPRSFAALIFSQTAIFPKNSLKVPFFLPSLWFSIHIFHQKNFGCSMIFPHFPSIFPAFSNRFSWFPGPPLPPRCRTTTWAEARAWERTPEPPKRASCVGWFAWRRKWGPLGPWWRIGCLVVGGIFTNYWGMDFPFRGKRLFLKLGDEILIKFWLGTRKEFWKFGENVVLNQTFLRDDLGGKWRHLDRFYEILTIGLCFFWAVLIKRVDIEMYLIVLENCCLMPFEDGSNSYGEWRGMFAITMSTAEYSVFEPVRTCWFSGYFTFNLFRAKADERKPQYWLLLLNKGWIYLTFFLVVELSSLSISVPLWWFSRERTASEP